MIRNYNVLDVSRDTTFKNRSVIDVDISSASVTSKSKKPTTYLGWLIAFLLMFGLGANAQITGYGFSEASGAYVPITGGTVVATATANDGGVGSLDDNIYNLPNGTIPFTFTFNGTGYTGLNISTNGFITFGATAPAGTNYAPISSTAGYSGAIAAWAGDSNSLFAIGGFTGEIRYQTVGSEFVIQWSNFTPYVSSAPTTDYWRWNYQIRLHSDGTIRLVYDSNFAGAPLSNTRQIGLRGATNAFATNVKNRLITSGTHTWNTSAAGTANSSVCAFSTTLLPTSGKTFIFTPPASMAYASSTTEQITGQASSPSVNNAIIRVKVVTTGSVSPLSLTSLTLNANGTTNIANINASTAKVYYTGASAVFSTATLFGSATPTIANFNVTGTQALAQGDNYFWLAYDVAPGATAGNLIDGEATSMTISAVAYTPTVTAPAGNKSIAAPLAGTYTVGSGGNYTSLTNAGGAFEAINNLGSSANITLNITSDLSAETGAVALNTVAGGFSVLIKPSGAPRAISGSANTALIRFNGANNVTVDGSTSGGTDRSLTITNNSATTPGVLLFGSVGTTPISNGVLKNCILINGVNTSSAVVVSDGTTLGGAGYFSNITIQNNSIQKAYIGVYVNAGTTPANGANLTLTQNNIDTAGANSVRGVGLYMQGVTGGTVSQNTIANLSNSEAEIDYGIWAATGSTGITISNNTVNNLGMTSTGAFGPYGIRDS